MKGLIAIFLQDLISSLRSYFFVFNTIILIISAALIYLDSGEQPGTGIYVVNNSKSSILKEYLNNLYSKDSFLNSEEEVINKVRESESSIGYLFVDGINGLCVKYIHNERIGKQDLLLVEASIESNYSLFLQKKGNKAALPIQVNILSEINSEVSLKENIIVIILTLQISVLGYLLIAVMIFNDKKEGYIKAYRITPGGVPIYIAGKLSVWILFTVLYGVLFIILTKGLDFQLVQWLKLIIVLFVSGMFFSLLGMGTAVYFNGIADWFIIALLLIVIILIPEFNYFDPFFSPVYIIWIPTYSELKVFKDIVTGNDNTKNFSFFLLQFGIYNVIIAVFVVFSVYKKLFRY